MIKEQFELVAQQYLTDYGRFHDDPQRPRSLDNYPSSVVIRTELPAAINRLGAIPNGRYKTEGSVGAGNMTHIPWISIFDREITQTAQRGYYIVYLFKTDLTGFYLSLNQGWIQYRERYGTPEGRIQIRRNAETAKELLQGTQGFSFNDIELITEDELGIGYQFGNICSKFYPSDVIPDDVQILDDLRNMIGVYRELKSIVGVNILNIKPRSDEDQFQEQVQIEQGEGLPAGPVPRGERRPNGTDGGWSRNPKYSAKAISDANHFCAFDRLHLTFDSEATGNQFIEAHHLVPMKAQDDFDPGLDFPENIISLCPNCHRAIHNSQIPVKAVYLRKFYNERIASINQRGINLTFRELCEYYHI